MTLQSIEISRSMKLSLPFADKLPRIPQREMPAIGAPVMVLATLAMVVLPIPAFLLDMFFTFNIALSMVVLLVTVYTRRPLDFAAFPTVLLIATLLRLALNVASTRVVLLHGHEGGNAAGNVIEAFGNVVIGGNYAVGLVVFLILMIINFMVVTKGAGRISEVSARFTLDALPGKQMAIDADLNAGLIDQEQARVRRFEVTKEADFYGSMDGASKFVKGDAIAGILILFINIVGGLSIGMAQYGLGFGEAIEIYTLLTIGDGLVAQIPSLLLSIAAAMMVTRQNTDEDMGEQLVFQMFDNPKALMITAAILGVMGIVPGMPHFAFLSLAVAAGAAAYFIDKRQKQKAKEPALPATADEGTEPSSQRELSWDDVQPVDIIGLEVGYRLIPLVDRDQGGELLERVKGVRKKLSQDFGFLIPAAKYDFLARNTARFVTMKKGSYDRTQVFFYLIILLASAISLLIYGFDGLSDFYLNIYNNESYSSFDQADILIIGSSLILFECSRMSVKTLKSNNFLTKSEFKSSSKIFLTISVTSFFLLYPSLLAADVFAKSNGYSLDTEESTYNLVLEKRTYRSTP